MKLFQCDHCRHGLYFHNDRCVRCKRSVGYLHPRNAMTSLTPAEAGFRSEIEPQTPLRYCANQVHGVCNWLVAAEGGATLCLACGLNRTIPDLGQPGHLERWRRIERAKHRLVYSLLRLELPVFRKRPEAPSGMAFDFLADCSQASSPHEQRVVTGHLQGLVTINIAEADDVERERQRQITSEPYRTILGHFRHEIGHYYWSLIATSEASLSMLRSVFGDERADYAAALARYYSAGPPARWQSEHVSAYAASHPWEDWAETWAHYLHMVDTLETAGAFGLRAGDSDLDHAPDVQIDFDAYTAPAFEALVEAWLPLTSALNEIARSMGQPDLYPFVLSRGALAKIRVVHGLIREGAAQRGVS